MKKILCFLGWHNWTCSIDDIIDEFKYIPLDARIASKAKCSRCGRKYSNKNN